MGFSADVQTPVTILLCFTLLCIQKCERKQPTQTQNY